MEFEEIEEQLIQIRKKITEQIPQRKKIDNDKLWQKLASIKRECAMVMHEIQTRMYDDPLFNRAGGKRKIKPILHNIIGNYNSEYHYLTKRWVDHAYYKNNVFVSEPYQVFLEDLKNIVTLCEEMNLGVYITGKSKHYPGETVRIEVYTKDITNDVLWEEFVNSWFRIRRDYYRCAQILKKLRINDLKELEAYSQMSILRKIEFDSLLKSQNLRHYNILSEGW